VITAVSFWSRRRSSSRRRRRRSKAKRQTVTPQLEPQLSKIKKDLALTFPISIYCKRVE